MTSIDIVEVSPRDGLQNEETHFSTHEKLELIGRCVEAGLKRVEATSFVQPARVPQMADAEEVIAGLPSAGNVSYSALALNVRGFERARAVGVTELNVVVLATETFNQRNQGTDIDGSLAVIDEIASVIVAPMKLTLTIGATFGCPFEGEVDIGEVLRIAERGAAAGVQEVCLADTIGVATPKDVQERLAAVTTVTGTTRLRCHFHDTRHTGIANAIAAIEAGATALDASLGGIGGCPFAPRATGNIATEDLVYVLERMGIDTGTSVDRIIAHVPWLEEMLGKPVPGALSRTGGFPRG